MGKKSIKPDKNIYQLSREECELTREKAGMIMQYVTADRIEKIESEKSLPHPEEILAMASCYKKPELLNYYCSQTCPIGQRCVPELKIKDLSQITLEMLASLIAIEKDKDRLVEITVDGKITEDELQDFLDIHERLSKIAVTIDSLQLWIEHAVNEDGNNPLRNVSQLK